MPFIGKNPTAGFATIVKDDFTPNGTDTTFTLSKQVANANDIAVFVGNVRQEPTTAYTVNGTTLDFGSGNAPANGLNMYVLHIAGTLESSVIPADGTITSAKMAPGVIGSGITVNSNDPTFSSNKSPVGHMWINSTSGAMYILTDTTTNANVWANVDGSGSISKFYTINYLLVGGGGSAGALGGGGAGGMVEASLTGEAGVTYTISVGAGGSASGGGGGSNANGSPGGNTTMTSVATTVLGGGYGAGGDRAGGSGGSGGGAGADQSAQTGGAGTSGQGNAGGNSAANGAGTAFAGGGGGGKSAVGANAPGTTTGGAGGAGATSTIITATNAGTYSVGEVSGGSVYFAGGGGAGAYSLNGTGVSGAGGLGGGGTGGRNGLQSIAGTDYTGGGGGGQGLTSGGTSQGSRVAGGDGVVILKMPVANYSGTYTGNSVNSFVQGSDRVLIFKSSGTYTA